MSRFDNIDLSKLTPPDVVETLSETEIIDQMKAKLAELDPEYSAQIIESDPAI